MTGHIIRQRLWGTEDDQPQPYFGGPFTARALAVDCEGAESVSVFVRVDFDKDTLTPDSPPFLFALTGRVHPADASPDGGIDLVVADLADAQRARQDYSARFVELRVERPTVRSIGFGTLHSPPEYGRPGVLAYAAVRY